MTILISACLLGVNCRYNGKTKEMNDIQKLMKKHTLIPVCPEILGGLPTPRAAVEIQNGRCINTDGIDVTEQFERGAKEVLRLAKLYNCDTVIFQERSPSCGSGQIYDGSFTGTLTTGDGMTARLLKENGIKIIGDSKISTLI